MKPMTMAEAGRFVAIVAAILFTDVIVRAILFGYHAAKIGGGDTALAIGATLILMNRIRLGHVRDR